MEPRGCADRGRPGDVLRFEPAGHHIAIIIPGGMRLGLAHSNEAYFLDPADGVFVGDVDLASADSTDAIGAKLKAAIPVIMGDSSTFVGFRRLAVDGSLIPLDSDG